MKEDDLSALLSNLDDDFEKITGYDIVPDGVYWTVADNIDLTPTRSGNPKITWTLKILGPDHCGRQLQRVFVVTAESLRWLKRDLFLCGLELESLADLPARSENLLNLKLKVRKQGRSVYILEVDSPVTVQSHLFLHFVQEGGTEYLDQQLRPRQRPRDQQEFEAVIDHFVHRYQCPPPHEAFVEDSRTGEILYSTDPS